MEKALEYVKDSFKKDDIICLEAVAQNGLALQYVDDSLRNNGDFCLKAIKQNEKF